MSLDLIKAFDRLSHVLLIHKLVQDFDVSDLAVYNLYLCETIINDNRLCFDAYLNSLCPRLNFLFRRLYSLNAYMHIEIKVRVGKALIRLLVMYALQVYSSTNTSNVRKFRFILCIRIVRYVFSLRRHDHVSGYVLHFLCCSFFFFNFIKVRLLLSLYNIILRQVPKKLSNLFSLNNRSVRKTLRLIPRVTCSLGQMLLGKNYKSI